MQIDRPRADRATSGQRHVGFAETGNQRSQHEDRGTHRFDKFVGRAEPGHRVAVDLDIQFFIESCLRAHALQQGDHRSDVSELRHIPDRDRLGRKQSASQDWQCGILRARNRDGALQARATSYE